MLPEVGATELLVIAAIALIVVGPKDLPVLMRRVGQFVARMRSMAMEFRSSFDELARQSELEELRREVEAMRAAAHQPIAAVGQAAGFEDVHSEIAAAHAEIQGALTDATSAPSIEQLVAPEGGAAAPPAEAPAAEAPKPRRRRAKKAAPDAPPAAPEAQP